MIYSRRNAAVVLGCLLQQPSLLADSDKYMLTTDDFADRLHRILFSTVYNMFHSGVEHITVNEVNAYLKVYPELYDTFNQLKGNDAMLTAIEIAEVGNFQFYYDKLKKMSLLRSLQTAGFNVSQWYVEDTYDIGKRQELEERLEKATINEIVQSYTSKISNIESQYVNRQSFNFGNAFHGVEKLLEQLKRQPEIGLPLQGEVLTTITRGSRKGKFYLLSARSGVGKSRAMVGHSCFLAYPLKWDIQKEKWVVSGSTSKTLLITTELDRGEIQTMIISYLSGVNEEKILNGTAKGRELERIDMAVQIMKYYEDNLLIYHMPDPNVTQLNSNIRRLTITHGIRSIFFDYIHTSAQLLAEFSGARVREDVVLLLMSTTLKNLANELDVFIWSSTQVNSNEPDADFADEGVIRGSRAIPDKADFGCVLRYATPEKLKTIQALLKTGLPRPNMFIDIYKNRRSQHKRVRLWLQVDLGICRFDDLFLTNEYGEQIPVELLRAAYAQDVPTIEEIIEMNSKIPETQAVEIPQSTIIEKINKNKNDNGTNITV